MAYHHKQSVDNSMGRNQADLILRGGNIVDVHSGLIRQGDVIVTGHRIVGLYDHRIRPETQTGRNYPHGHFEPGPVFPHVIPGPLRH